ncbi:MAG TPA: hypothetical protein VN634_01570 [Candidatus Limnocylindrales bacterium]|nr:hypothetical protein [Candidatus Limnocylindrales bacterium]
MRTIGLLLAMVLACPVVAAAAGPPLQASLSIAMPAENGEMRYDVEPLEGGGAEAFAVAINGDDGRTVEVRFRFSYSIPPDTIALDEIVDHVTVATIDDAGNVIGSARLRTGEINVNPNGPWIRYRVTLYRPESAYRVRVRVFGNYE